MDSRIGSVGSNIGISNIPGIYFAKNILQCIFKFREMFSLIVIEFALYPNVSTFARSIYILLT